MVPVDDQRVFVERRRASFAVPVQRLHRSKIGFPDQLAVDVEAIQPERAKEANRCSPSVTGEFDARLAVWCPCSCGSASRSVCCQRILPLVRLTARATNLWRWVTGRLS